jgi:PLP dependent protein
MISANLTGIHADIDQAAKVSGREKSAVRLCVVTKTFSAETILEAYAAGERLFGENRVQELLAKTPALPSDVQWHIIGHLQSNKVRKALQAGVRCIQSVDSLEIAQDISRIAGELGRSVEVLFQVNIAHDPAKHGWLPEEMDRDITGLIALPHLVPTGLMTIPELAQTPEEARPHFAALREYRDRLEKRCGRQLPELSMGMSSDFIPAIEEGATIVRVGSRVFGRRS